MNEKILLALGNQSGIVWVEDVLEREGYRIDYCDPDMGALERMVHTVRGVLFPEPYDLLMFKMNDPVYGITFREFLRGYDRFKIGKTFFGLSDEEYKRFLEHYRDIPILFMLDSRYRQESSGTMSQSATSGFCLSRRDDFIVEQQKRYSFEMDYDQEELLQKVRGRIGGRCGVEN